MRLKEFIIFIIIFTILYILFFVVFDYFVKKDADKQIKKNKDSLFKYDSYLELCAFYDLKPIATLSMIISIFQEIKDLDSFSISQLATKYVIPEDELITIILFLEKIEEIDRRDINVKKDEVTKLVDKDDWLIVKYSLLFSNKVDYDSIINKTDFNAKKELEYINERMLFPGVKIIGSKIHYYGDHDED